jgi:hypothetical protein
MLTEPHRVRIDPDSELARLLDEVGEMPVLLEKNGKLYRLTEETTEEKTDNLWAHYDPEKARAALRRVAGSWADIDVDILIADLYRAREEGSRPSTRP